jgi:hypothetical protein
VFFCIDSVSACLVYLLPYKIHCFKSFSLSQSHTHTQRFFFQLISMPANLVKVAQLVYCMFGSRGPKESARVLENVFLGNKDAVYINKIYFYTY